MEITKDELAFDQQFGRKWKRSMKAEDSLKQESLIEEICASAGYSDDEKWKSNRFVIEVSVEYVENVHFRARPE